MKRSKLITLTLAVLAAQSLQADQIREIDQAELRARVASDQTLRPGPILHDVQGIYDAVAVDLRVFSPCNGCALFYRILLKGSDAAMRMVVVDAATGAILPMDSAMARNIGTSARRAVADGQIAVLDEGDENI